MTTLFVEGLALRPPHTGVSRYATAMLAALLERYDKLELAVGVVGNEEIDVEPLAGFNDRLRIHRSRPSITRRRYRVLLSAGAAPPLEWVFPGLGPYHAALFPDFVRYPHRAPVPELTIIHDATVRSMPDDKPLRFRLGFGRLIQLSLSDSTCAAVSAAAAQEIAAHFRISEPLSVIYPCVAGPAVPAQERGAHFVTIGTHSARKNLQVVLDAVQRLAFDAPSIIAIGKDHGALPGVTVSGFVPDDELGRLLRSAKALIAPSRNEGFDLPVAEAVAAGTPVIASRIPVHEEVLGADHPYFFDPDDADGLAQLLTLPELTPSPISLLDRFSAQTVAQSAGRLLGLEAGWSPAAGA